jgi:uncharacterized SAM-binding protein YcdF (DUF218 family)
MFFVLSKILLFLLSPGFWILFLLAWSFATKREKRKKGLRIATLVIFIVFTNPWLFNVLVRSWQPERKGLPPGRYSAVILLGGMTMVDKQQRSYFGSDADRFIQATRLYHTGQVEYIAVTGGSPKVFKKDDPAEALRLYPELRAQGIPGERIIVESASRNTFENAVFVRRKLDSLQLKPPYLLVTSALHIPRALAVFKKAGIEVIPCPAAFKQVNGSKSFVDYIAPSFELLTQWRFFLKEVVGLVVYRITGKA